MKNINENRITIELSNIEGLILMDLIARLTDDEKPSHEFHEAEERLLWDLECILEKYTVMPMGKKYSEEMKELKDSYMRSRGSDLYT